MRYKLMTSKTEKNQRERNKRNENAQSNKCPAENPISMENIMRSSFFQLFLISFLKIEINTFFPFPTSQY